MRRLVSALLLAAFMASSAAAGTTYVRAGRLLDVETGKVRTGQCITIITERITQVAQCGPAPKGATVVDWRKYTVLPGLIDLHTHLADVGQGADIAEPIKTGPAETAFIGAKNARDTLRAGFTTVRDVGTFRVFSDVKLRDAIDRGLIPGPRMAVVGTYLTIPGGGGEINGLPPGTVPDEMRFGVVRTPEEARAKAEALFKGGADFLKLIATGAVLAIGTEPGQPELTEAEMRAAVEVAKAHGSYATAHAHGAEGIKAAIRAGVRSIEHASLIDEEGSRSPRPRASGSSWMSIMATGSTKSAPRKAGPPNICARTARRHRSSATCSGKVSKWAPRSPSGPTAASIRMA
ncbi:MAG: amidohydrolase family protein, partial [Chakrabartia godavariana]